MRSIVCAVILAAAASTALADGLIKKRAKHSVGETLDRLTRAVTEKGFTVIARIDHAGAASKAGMTLPPTELLIFGNPKIGTQLMSSVRSIGLDLPVKVLAWEEPDGSVWVTYTDPAVLLARHGIQDQAAIEAKMTAALAAFTDAATEE